MNSKRIVVFIFLFIYFFFFIFYVCVCVCIFLETFGKREIQNLHWQTYKVRLFMVIVITLILVSFIYVLCQLGDWRYFSNSHEIASNNRSTDLIFVCVCAFSLSLALSISLCFFFFRSRSHGRTLFIPMSKHFWCMRVVCFFLFYSTFFFGFKLTHGEFVSLVSLNAAHIPKKKIQKNWRLNVRLY